MRLWGMVSHVGSVRFYGAYELPDRMVLVTEVCEGGCLLDLLLDNSAQTLVAGSTWQAGSLFEFCMMQSCSDYLITA